MLTNNPIVKQPKSTKMLTSTKLDSEENKKRAEALFSKKFIEYLTTKKASTSSIHDRSYSLAHVKEATALITPSSDETTASESSKKPGKKVRKKLKERPSYRTFDYHVFRNKLIQCSLLKEAEEIAPPEELKPLLVNMTILLQELKQSKEIESLYNLISRVTILITEFVRRPLKKSQVEKVKGEYSKQLQQTAETMVALLNEYKTKPGWDCDNDVREYKKIQKEIGDKDQQIAEARKRLAEMQSKVETKSSDILFRVKSSILNNERLKAEIKFNQSHIKKYKKALLEKEWTKHKLETELSHLKKKGLRSDVSDGDYEKHFPEGGSDNMAILSQKMKELNTKKTKRKQKLGGKS